MRELIDEPKSFLNELGLEMSNRVRPVASRQALAMIACGLVILAFLHAQRNVAYLFVSVLTSGGLFASMRRVPLALSLTLGLVIGLALVSLS